MGFPKSFSQCKRSSEYYDEGCRDVVNRRPLREEGVLYKSSDDGYCWTAETHDELTEKRFSVRVFDVLLKNFGFDKCLSYYDNKQEYIVTKAQYKELFLYLFSDPLSSHRMKSVKQEAIDKVLKTLQKKLLLQLGKEMGGETLVLALSDTLKK